MKRRRLPTIAEGALPPQSARWMAELLGDSIPIETEATCNDCAMVPRDRADLGQREHQHRYFDPELKCCTYLPVIANFQVGKILADGSAAAAKGRATVVERIAQKSEVTPLGLGRSPLYRVLYTESVESGRSAFGRAKSLRCPHLLDDGGGSCGVWRHRPSRCTTWFCKHVRGAVGAAFWDATGQLLSAVENTLARHCALEIGVGVTSMRTFLPNANRRLSRHDLDGVPNEEAYALAWGDWVGREEELYRRCAGIVEPLGWADILAIGGPEVRILAQIARDAFSSLQSTRIPTALSLGNHQVVRADEDRTTLATYNPNDPIDLPRPLVEALHYFDGRPTARAREAIAKERGLDLDDDLVRRLVDFEVLVPPAQR